MLDTHWLCNGGCRVAADARSPLVVNPDGFIAAADHKLPGTVGIAVDGVQLDGCAELQGSSNNISDTCSRKTVDLIAIHCSATLRALMLQANVEIC